MRGGSHAQLLQADDGHHYIVKFQHNPQHKRILINELLCHALLDYLQLPIPQWAIITVPQELIETTPHLIASPMYQPGLHFGSRYPGDPSKNAVYDYVPLSVLRTVANIDTFTGMLAFDKWVSNADGRQAIFTRERDGQPARLQYVARMIDHGFAFDAHNWEFPNTPEQGLYTRREVYERVTGYDSFEPWLSRIHDCPTRTLDDAYVKIPAEWIEGDRSSPETVLDTLYQRRHHVPELLREAKKCSRDPFPNWSTRR